MSNKHPATPGETALLAAGASKADMCQEWS
jgi:hypothetical protein